MRSAARKASASMVMVGWPRPEVTKLLPSQRKRFLTSWLRWSELITDVFGSFPASGAEKMLGELLLPCRETPVFLRTGGVKDFMSACEHPIPKLQIIRRKLRRLSSFIVNGRKSPDVPTEDEADSPSRTIDQDIPQFWTLRTNFPVFSLCLESGT
jgi:hypothetical protein